MKTKVFLLLLTAAFLSTQAVSARGNEVKKEIRKPIAKAMNKIPFGDDGSATIYLNVDESKNVSISHVEGSNSELVSKVEKALQNVKFNIADNLAGNYAIKVNFIEVAQETVDLVASR